MKHNFYLLLIIFALLMPYTAHATRGIVVYMNTTNSAVVPQYRLWNGTDFGAETSTGISAGTVGYLKVVTSPKRDEAIMGIQDASGDIIFAVYNGTSNTWDNSVNVTRIIGRSTFVIGRAFDIAYENISGNAIAVFRNGSTGASAEVDGVFRIWNGTKWDTVNRGIASDSCAGGPSWVRAEGKPNSNQVVVVTYNVTTNDICGQVWNGTAWGSAQTFTLSGETTTPKRIFDITSEGLTGRMMVAWADGAATVANSTTWNGTTWTQQGALPVGGLTLASSIQWIELGNDIASDRIVYAGVDGGADLDVWHWDGTTWGTGAEPDSAIETIVTKDISAGFYNGTGDAFESDGVSLYGTGAAGDGDFGYVDCQNNTTCQAGTWTVRSSVTGCGANINWVKIDQDPYNSSEAMAVTVSQGASLNACVRRFNNTGWSSTTVIGNAPARNESAFFAYNRFTSTPSLKANGTITGASTILTGQSTVVTGSCESNTTTSAQNVNIILQNSTDNSSFTTISTTNTQPIYANVSSYSIDTLTNANSTVFFFNVTANKVGTHTLRIQCNATNTVPIAANTTGANLTVTQAFGYLNVTLVSPSAASTNVNQDLTFTVNASVMCQRDDTNPTAICDAVNGTVRRNSTAGGQPNTNLPASSGTPFFTVQANPQTCGVMNMTNQNCSLQWTVNASGSINSNWTLDVNLTSNNTNTISDDTTNFEIIITGAAAIDVSFVLFIPATNSSFYNSTSSPTTGTVIFNSTNTNGIKINATWAQTGVAQNSTVSIFRYRNTGNTALNITLNFSATLPSGVTVKAAWNDTSYQATCTLSALNGTSNDACTNITAGPVVRVANLSAADAQRDIWLWADYSNVAVNTDTTVNLQHVSGQA